MDLKEAKRIIEELIKTNEHLEKENIAFEMEVKASQKIINKLKRDTRLMIEYEDAVIERDEKLDKMEKHKSIAENVIKKLKEELRLKEQNLSA